MKKMIILSFLFVAMLAGQSFAAWTGKQTISVIKAQTGGLYILLDGYTNTNADVTCSSNAFFLPDSDTNYSTKAAFLMAAFMGNEQVNFSYYGCTSNYIKLGSVQFAK